MKTGIWIMVITVILALQTVAVVKVIQENRRLSDNFDAVANGIQYGYTRDSLHTAHTERLLLETSEIKRVYPEVAESIAQLNVKMRQLERYSAVNLTASYNLATPLKDTVIIRDRIVRDTVKMQYIQYKSEWIDFQQAIVADSAYTSIRTRDSISIIQSWERPHRFWFLQWGHKRHIQSVTNANPHSRVTYSIYVEKQ